MSTQNSKLKTQNSYWPLIIAGALGLHVLAMLVMVSVATSNDSYAVEPDYYRKALAWDEKQTQDRRNAELGWVLDFVVEPAAPGSDPTLEVTLVDGNDHPIGGARVEVEAFSNVRRNDVFTAAVTPSGEGYRTTMPIRGNGRWEFRFTVTRGNEMFTHAVTRHIWTKFP